MPTKMRTWSRQPGAESSVDDIFWSRVHMTDTCWVWTTWLDRDGYAVYRFRGKNVRAHRVAYEQMVGLIPEGMTLDHLCRNRACVRPDHLEAVTAKVNALRGMSPTAVAYRANRCLRGHELAGENVRWQANGQRRMCRTCANERKRAWRASRKKVDRAG